MDLKNTLADVSLSAAIIVLWGLFFSPDADQVKKAQLEKERNELINNEDAPKLIENEEIKLITRENAINESERVTFENNKLDCWEHSNLLAAKAEGSKRAGEILMDKRRYFLSCMKRKGWVLKVSK